MGLYLKHRLLHIILVAFVSASFAQNDSINKKLLYANLAFDAVAITGGYFVLNELWYKDYEQSDMHWFNDCNEWLQMDKLGHSFSTYHLSSLYTEQMRWSGLSDLKSAIIGTSLGFATISTIELLDARSEQWGASACDLTANAFGSALYLTQELLWAEQRLTMKFSYQATHFASYRPELLGSTFGEQLIKDYNGQTYWLSANVRSFTDVNWWPKWLNVAAGYGATGMLGGEENPSDLPHYDRVRQYYLSLDIDLRKIPVKSKFLKATLSVLNIIKIPMPTLEYSSGNWHGHYLFF